MNTETFSAIRRAAAVARHHDDAFRQYIVYMNAAMIKWSRKEIDADYALVEIEGCADSAWTHQARAEAIREAIRAAIGSVKA